MFNSIVKLLFFQKMCLFALNRGTNPSHHFELIDDNSDFSTLPRILFTFSPFCAYTISLVFNTELTATLPKTA